LKQKIRLRRQQIRTKNLLPAYQETEHGSEWGVKLQDKILLCFLFFFFPTRLGILILELIHFYIRSSFLPTQASDVRTKTSGSRYASQIVLPPIYIKTSKA
jgi:hypothetical protein